MDMVAAATHLPADLIWWKSHNFVEMSYELITDGDYPQIKNELLTALYDTEAKKTAAQILSSYAEMCIRDRYNAWQQLYVRR